MIKPLNILLAITQYHKARNNSQTLIPTSAVKSPKLSMMTYLPARLQYQGIDTGINSGP